MKINYNKYFVPKNTLGYCSLFTSMIPRNHFCMTIVGCHTDGDADGVLASFLCFRSRQGISVFVPLK